MTCVNHETGVVILSYLHPQKVSSCIFQMGAFPGLLKLEILQVEPAKFGILANWQREYTMEDILTQLRKEMAAPHNRKLVQPPEGTFF